MIRILSRFFALAIILIAFNSNAKVFRNAYISFEMPDTWKCVLEQTEWVCRSDPDKYAKESKEAIIILTAKEVGPTDSIPQYEQHLNNPIQMTGKNGVIAQSKIQYKAKQVQINDQMWIDGLHLGSEVNNYFTRYFATIKDKIAILVTFSAHQMYYAKYSQDFFKAIMSMRVIASKNLLSRPDVGPIRPGTETIGSTIAGAMPADMGQMEQAPEGTPVTTYLGIALLLGAVGVYLFIRAKKNS